MAYSYVSNIGYINLSSTYFRLGLHSYLYPQGSQTKILYAYLVQASDFTQFYFNVVYFDCTETV
jgi:hypothetical protein